MAAYWTEIRDQLTDDIIGVLGEGSKVFFGQPRKQIKTFPHAVVRTAVDRANVARQVQETYNVEIEMRLALPDPNVEDIESMLFEKGMALTARLAPWDKAAPPTPAGPYAGVASLRRVTSITPSDVDDTVTYCAVQIVFSCMATIYQ